MEAKKKERILYFDVMNILACIAVVFQHHNSHMHSFDGSFSWTVSLAMECMLYWSVPVFLMISGANLLGYHEKYDTKTFFQKRLLRVAVPWLIWSLVMLVWKLATGQLKGDPSPLECVQLVLSNNVEGIYWFFGTLFLLYSITPLLTYLTPHRKLLWYTVGVLFVLSAVQPVLGDYLPIPPAIIDALRNSLVIYYLLGYLLNTTQLSKKQRILLYLAAVISVAVRFFGSYFTSVAAQATTLTVRGNKMCNAIVTSSALFVFWKQVRWEKWIPGKVQAVLPLLASYSFGVYLLHRIVIYHLRDFLGLGLSSLRWKTLWAPVTYCICIAIIAILKKIPVIRKYIC